VSSAGTPSDRGVPAAAPARTALELATMLRDLVDVMLPGDEGWPSGSLAGTHGLLGFRLQEVRGEQAAAELAAAIDACGGPLAPLDEAARVAVVARLEQEQPSLFALVRSATYLAYYESPAVIPAIQALGQPYRAMPGREGYPQVPFDLEQDRPRHNRGAYVQTDAVRRVDLKGILESGGSDGRP
jgi:hypothetical protein